MNFLWLRGAISHVDVCARSLFKSLCFSGCGFGFAIVAMRSLRVLLCLLPCAFADAGSMPDINVRYDVGPANMASADARTKFVKRTSELAAAVRQTDVRISEFSELVGQALQVNGQTPRGTSFLGLQPVDASRVRKSLAATEPMAPSSQAAVNVVMAEDVGAIMGTATYKGMLDEIYRLRGDFEHDVAKLADAA